MPKRLLFGLLIVFALGCFSDIPTGNSSVNGAYSLRTVNGAQPPYTTSSNATTRTETLDDLISLFQGSTFSRLKHVRTTTNNVASTAAISETGSFGLQGNSITFNTNETGKQTVAIINGGTMTFVDAGVTFVFKK